MKVNEPSGYDVKVTTEEIKIMNKCKEVLQGITEILEEKGCDTLVDWESDEVYLETIATMITDLDIIIGVKRMY